MESVASSSTPPDHTRPPPQRHRFNPSQPFSDRVIRAIRHRLRLLHLSDSLFFILGATGNVYTVNISTTPSCSCPDRATPCKHILFVFIRVLGVPLDDSCLWRRTLRPCQVHRLLNMPISGESLAGAAVRERFHQLFFQPKTELPAARVAAGGGACPVCLEEMGMEERVVACGTCKNVIHEECFVAWKRSCRRRSATCVLCRARWRNGGGGGGDQEKYLNLSAYVIEDDMVEGNGQCN